MLTATCHCGAVTITLARKPVRLVRCTCSICSRYAALWAYCSRKTAHVLCPPDATRAYIWNDREIAFHHCTTCGCVTHYEGMTGKPDERLAVNARLLPAVTLAGIRIRTFDGADTWRYLD